MKKKMEFFTTRDVFVSVLSFCSLDDLNTISQVSKNFNFFSSAAPLWRSHFKRDFGMEVPKGKNPKDYYQTMKHQLLEEKENVLNYYASDVLVRLERDLKDARASGGNYVSERLTQNFTREQIAYLCDDSIYNYIKSESKSLRKNYNTLCDKIDNELLAHIKNIARPYFEGFFKEDKVSSADELPMSDCSPLFFFYTYLLDSGCWYDKTHVLQILIHKHPEAVNQLVEAAGSEIVLLCSFQFSKEELFVQRKTKSINFLNFLLSCNIDLNCRILAEDDLGITAKSMAQLHLDKLKLIQYLFSQLQKQDIRQTLEAEIHNDHKPYLLEALKKLEILSTYYKEEADGGEKETDDFHSLIHSSVRVALDLPLEEQCLLEIDPDIELMMNKIIQHSELGEHPKLGM